MPGEPLSAERFTRTLFPAFKVVARCLKMWLKLQLPSIVARTEALAATVTVGRFLCLAMKCLMSLVVTRRVLVVSLLPL